MAAVSFKFTGLHEFKEELRALPTKLHAEGRAIVQSRGERAKSDIETSYPERTGNLKNGLSVKVLDRGPTVAAAEVRNTAPHANLFEVGSQTRKTALGANRGSMPPGNIFVPIIIRQRRAMFEQDFPDLLTRHGLTVTGGPD